jgi:hypothetical protein
MKKVSILVFGLLVASLTLIGSVSAADLNDQTRAKIAENCSVAQSTLQRISSSDTTTRINRGRDYDQVLKLFHAMNTRAASNNIAEPKLTELTKSFETALNDFRTNYNQYNDQLKGTYESDCKNQTQTFYDALQKTRDGRSKINNDINKLDALINEYQVVVGGLAGEK